MKWLNLITQDETFTQLDYELFDSQEDLEIYGPSTGLMKTLLDEKMVQFNEALNKIETYAKKSKKNINHILGFKYSDFDFPIYTAYDPKIEKYVNTLNETAKYSILSKYIISNYEFTDREKELIPELREIPTINYRFVNAITFAEETSWEKLKVPYELRHAFVVAMAMRDIAEDIV